MTSFRIGLLAFPAMTQLDMTGPLQVFAMLPGAEVRVIWKTLEPIDTHGGLRLIADTVLAECPPLDVLCIPGGRGVFDLIRDPEILDFVRHQAEGARFVGSICTGAIVLGAAGLLRGRKATTHWAYTHLLEPFGAEPAPGRVVRDGKFLTGGGVTAGIDFGLTMVAELAGREAAEVIQLQVEYAPAPPFEGGTPERARPEVLSRVEAELAPTRALREAVIREVTTATA